MLQTSATVSKRFRIGPKSCILLQLFEAPCVRNSLIVKDLEHEKHRNALLQTLRRECTFAAAWKLRSSADTRKVHHLYFSALAVLNCCFNWHPVPSLQILFCFFRFRRAFFFFRWFFFFLVMFVFSLLFKSLLKSVLFYVSVLARAHLYHLLCDNRRGLALI